MKYDTRINKIIGQLEALARVSDEESMVKCDQVLQQVNAVQGAVASLKKQIIDDSLERCISSRHAHKEAKKLLLTVRRYI